MSRDRRGEPEKDQRSAGGRPGAISRLQRSVTWMIAVGGAAVLAMLLAGGCGEEERCPSCPRPGIEIDRIHALPDTATTGASIRLWAIATGDDLQYRWSATAGEFQEIISYYALWKAPDATGVAEITVVAFNDEEQVAHIRDMVVERYLPRHEPTYTGAGYCGLECHSADGHGANYATWIDTRHATTFTRVEASASFGSSCGGCHTVGFWDTGEEGWLLHNGGYDEVPIADLEGVQCESCHGPLADRHGEILDEHGELAGGDSLLALGTGALRLGCATCHEDAGGYAGHSRGKAYITEWETSAHARSAEEAETHEADCAHCHTAQGFLAHLESGNPLSEPVTDPFPIVCATCHDPHGSGAAVELRIAADQASGEVCHYCHSDGDAGYPDTPHAPQAQMLSGTGGYEYAGVEFTSSPHENVAVDNCVTCHYSSTAGLSHTFAGLGNLRADPQSCTACHPNANGVGFNWSDEIDQVHSLLTALEEEIALATPEDQATEEYARALFNLEFVKADGSSGAHNFEYAQQLLQSALDDFEPSE